MPLCSNPCPSCGKTGAQLLRHRPRESDYFCETCLTEFVEARTVPVKSVNVPASKLRPM